MHLEPEVVSMVTDSQYKNLGFSVIDCCKLRKYAQQQQEEATLALARPRAVRFQLDAQQDAPLPQPQPVQVLPRFREQATCHLHAAAGMIVQAEPGANWEAEAALRLAVGRVEASPTGAYQPST
jgi:hypothetical protein